MFAFFAGGGAVKFVKDYAAAGLKKSIPLMGRLPDRRHARGPGRLGQGLLTSLHYADGIDTPRNKAFRTKYAETYKSQPDVYAVQGYDAAQILAAGLTAVKGDFSKRDEMIAAMRKTTWTARAASTR